VARGGLALAAAALACASVPADPAADRCTPDASFERGLADGREGRAPDLAFVGPCAPELEAALRAAYGEGRRAGAAEREADAPAPEPAGAGERPYRCEVRARGESFSGEGPTRSAADDAARAACRARNPEALCAETTCRRGE
jgi:hypothetical protein